MEERCFCLFETTLYDNAGLGYPDARGGRFANFLFYFGRVGDFDALMDEPSSVTDCTFDVTHRNLPSTPLSGLYPRQTLMAHSAHHPSTHLTSISLTNQPHLMFPLHTGVL
jgi:hypothetical protein